MPQLSLPSQALRPVLLHLIALFTLILPAASYLIPRQAHSELYSPDSTARTLCVRPAPWNQIFSFFLTNYVARIATFKKTSGYEGYRDYRNTILSLFVPFVGISEAAATIARGSRFLGKDDVDRALLAQALCVIVREPGWRPEDGEIIRGCVIGGGDPEMRRKKRREIRRRKRREEGRSRERKGDGRSRERRGDGRSRERRGDGRKDRSRSRGVESRETRSHRKHRRHHSDRHHVEHDRLAEDYDADIDPPSDTDSDPDSYTRDTATLIVTPTRVPVISDPEKYKIQGYYSLPPSYTLAILPPGTTLQPLSASSATKEQLTISNSYGIVKSFTGVIQIVSSLYALYSAYGDESSQYGYAAFGFSVLPYTIMSFLNTIANLVEASYDTLYLVRSDVMSEAEHREHGEFIGEIAELVPASPEIEKEVAGTPTVDLQFHRRPNGAWRARELDTGREWAVNIPPDLAAYDPAADPRDKILIQPIGQSYLFNKAKYHRSAKFRRWCVWVIMVASVLIPYIVIAALCRFLPGQSTNREKVLMMGWLVSGQVIGVGDLVGQGTKAARKWPMWNRVEKWMDRGIVVVGFAISIGGFVVVGEMLRSFGYCILL